MTSIIEAYVQNMANFRSFNCGMSDGYNNAQIAQSPRVGLTLTQIEQWGDNPSYREGFSVGCAKWDRDNRS